jgi:Ribonuclease G/E
VSLVVLCYVVLMSNNLRGGGVSRRIEGWAKTGPNSKKTWTS